MTSELPLVSVICPVYNAEKHLHKCIKSVLDQTFSTFEFILVDDKSSDKSPLIINEFATKDSRIRYFQHTINQGEGATRFTGISNSKCEYLLFVDADDWLSKNAIELLYTAIKSVDADIVYGSFRRSLNEFTIFQSKAKNNVAKDVSKQINTCISQPELMDTFFLSYFGKNLLTVNMWSKMYKRATILASGVQPTNLKMGEDLSFNMQLHPYLKKVCLIPDVVYYYRYGGMTTTSNPTLLRDAKTLYNFKKDYIHRYNYTKALPFIHYEIVNIFYSHFINLKVLDNVSTMEIRNLLIDELDDPFYSPFEVFLTNHDLGHLMIIKDYSKILKIIECRALKMNYSFKLKALLSTLIKA